MDHRADPRRAAADLPAADPRQAAVDLPVADPRRAADSPAASLREPPRAAILSGPMSSHREPPTTRRSRARTPVAAAPIRTQLTNGIRVLLEPMDSIRSVSMGIWLVRGSRHESEAESGVSHFIEHMLFKGTTNRTAQDISRQMDAIGGGLDAFTGKEYACYHAKALCSELPLVVDILSDLVRNPLFAPADIEKERKVVLEEIKMVRDTPDDLVHEQLTERLWKGHPLGRPILGTPATVRAFDGASVRRFWRRTYGPENLLISVAGHFDVGALLALLEERLAGHRLGARRAAETPPRGQPVLIVKRRADLEQTHLCIGASGIPQGHADRHAAFVLNTILGGSMSSRLFQSIREDRGLAYSVYSFQGSYRDAGYMLVYAGCSPRRTRDVVLLAVEGIARLTQELVSDEELARSKGHLKGNLMLGLESSGSRMSSLARQEIYYGRQSSLDEMVAEIDAVTAEEVRGVARRLFQGRQLVASVLGRVERGVLRPVDLRV